MGMHTSPQSTNNRGVGYATSRCTEHTALLLAAVLVCDASGSPCSTIFVAGPPVSLHGPPGPGAQNLSQKQGDNSLDVVCAFVFGMNNITCGLCRLGCLSELARTQQLAQAE